MEGKGQRTQERQRKKTEWHSSGFNANMPKSGTQERPSGIHQGSIPTCSKVEHRKGNEHRKKLLWIYKFAVGSLTTSTTTGHSGFQYLSVAAIGVSGTAAATAAAGHGGRSGGIGSDA